MNKLKTFCILLMLAISGGGLMPADALGGAITVRLPNGLYVTKNVVSLREARYEKIVPQKFDLSCGAASLATILNYYYNDKVDEIEIINSMLERGNKDKIAQKGFSLLDLKRYAERNNYLANGYRVTIESLRNLKIPGIILLKSGKYSHFVVLKGIRGDRVYIADPASGNRSMGLDDFEKDWNGVILLVVSKKGEAFSGFSLESTLPAPMMNIIRVHEMGVGGFSHIKNPGEF